MLAFLLALLLYLVGLTQSVLRRRPRHYRKLHEPMRIAFRTRPKPPWVRREIIHLKALMREGGTCRAIEKSFNRRFARKKHMTVGRIFVNELIRKHRYQVELEQRRIKNRKPRLMPRNLVWGLDLLVDVHVGAVAVREGERFAGTLGNALQPAVGAHNDPGAEIKR